MNNLLIYTILAFVVFINLTSSIQSPYEQVRRTDCKECHGDIMAGEYVHPVAVDGCSLCHASTGEEHPNTDVTGFKLIADYPQICYGCHDDKNNKDNVHYPVQDGLCSTCHSPHSSSNASLILDDFSENSCTDCHVMDMEGKKSVHDPAGSASCTNCHDPHQSDYPRMIRKSVNDLCLDCHNKSVKSDGREIQNIKATLDQNNTIHDPIANGDCIICHLPHDSDFPRLLISEYPIRQFSEAKVENFELCFLCHDSEMITADSTEYATNFRNGIQNLHYFHINGSKGRNCNLCHNAHGAPNKHLIEETVRYGQWDMPMNAEFNENGGSCATGCHRKLEYSRVIN